jgi:N-acetyl sugar amidotransferase
MSAASARACRFCVMDETDPNIRFDESGRCNHCHEARARLETEDHSRSDGDHHVVELVERIKRAGRGNEYDCVVGLSGGADSSYAAVKAKELGLRPLVLHLDNGWNDELAVGNIEKLLDALGLDLHTHVVDWEEIRDLQRSFLLASVPNVEAITDHAIVALLFREAAKRGIRYILAGSNTSTETIMPTAWGYHAMDSKQIVGIHRRFGSVKLRTYPLLGPWRLFRCLFLKGIKWIPILNYVGYDKADAVRHLSEELGWVPYPRKHGESRFTRWFQEAYLVDKFNFDKRRAHLSSMICAGQLSREEALAELEEPLYGPGELAEDNEYLRKKLGFTERDLEEIMQAPAKSHRDYPNRAWIFEGVASRLAEFAKRFGTAQSA